MIDEKIFFTGKSVAPTEPLDFQKMFGHIMLLLHKIYFEGAL